MKIVFRWFGSDDRITLDQIKQIPGIYGVVSAIYDVPVGEVWPFDKIKRLKKQIENSGLKFEVVESVNVHEDIKLGLPSRDRYIQNYKTTIENLSKIGIKVVCYNFMPVFDWTRTDLNFKLEDGSNVLFYDDDKIKNLDPARLVEEMEKHSGGFSLPGWEPYRLKDLKKLFDLYKDMTEERLFKNLKYFLEQIIPTCEKCDVNMAIHPDDPPWSVFGLPRIVKNYDDLKRITDAVKSKYNGITLCTGSLGTNPKNDLVRMIKDFKERIHFVHARNVKILSEKKFHETAHLSSSGSIDLFKIMKSLHEINFDGYIRPDHGRMIWNETGRPGYGLYDRALGIAYINGLNEAIEKGCDTN
ncbi:mannonate dehydratase [Athalassotoga saccharophila]|uniref:mannonate dehydratase n=1 Tax=Athalassotoga saccharophila TaxID=1441386 RepID=UPI00137B8D67|nr:mannonate dehydratase [Athalassotoga saccharophila]BBJ27288.1 mannonate dehydratase [Athalassotoga saccharophila]